MIVYKDIDNKTLESKTKEEIIDMIAKYPATQDIIINTTYYALCKKRKLEYNKLSYDDIRNYIPKEYTIVGSVNNIEFRR